MKRKQPKPQFEINVRGGSFDDANQFDDPTSIESAYRRGFCHGAGWAVDAQSKGATADGQRRWFSRIYDWRRKPHRGFAEPPELPAVLTA